MELENNIKSQTIKYGDLFQGTNLFILILIDLFVFALLKKPILSLLNSLYKYLKEERKINASISWFICFFLYLFYTVTFIFIISYIQHYVDEYYRFVSIT